MKIAMFIVFLAMYTFVVNNRSEDPNIFEWLMYVFVCGYIFEEFRLVSNKFIVGVDCLTCIVLQTYPVCSVSMLITSINYFPIDL